jgi:cytochrome c oxidase assembly factor CtaG
VLHPDPRRRLTLPLRILYLFASTLFPTAPAAFLTFADYPFYSLYELAPRVSGISARSDQVVAGLLMKLAADPPVWVAMAVIFFRWQKEDA